MVSMRYHNNVVADFEQLVNRSPPAPLRPRSIQRRPWLTFGGRRSLASLSLARRAAPRIGVAIQLRRRSPTEGVKKYINSRRDAKRVGTDRALMSVGLSLDAKLPVNCGCNVGAPRQGVRC